MKRQGFILTEILTGMMLQVGFAIVLCSAFYMLLNFSSKTQQGFAANDKGQMVIAYFDSRIRNAGLGLWGCPSSKDIRVALDNIPALQESDASNRKNLCLPVAIVNHNDDITKSGVISYDRTTGVYSGNTVTLLYAHKDTNENGTKQVRLILLNDDGQPKTPLTLTDNIKSASNDFFLIDKAKNGVNSYAKSAFGKSTREKAYNIKKYAVMENVGVPVYTNGSVRKNSVSAVGLLAYTPTPPTIYPMTELLNLECQKLYTAKDENGYNFKFMELNEDSGKWGNAYYHTKDILELYMRLYTKPNTPDRIPIFELRVLVSEGINELGNTPKPHNWPGRWTDDFTKYKVHVSKATWKLYNLVHQFAD